MMLLMTKIVATAIVYGYSDIPPAITICSLHYQLYIHIHMFLTHCYYTPSPPAPKHPTANNITSYHLFI